MRLVAYLRVSTERQAEEGLGLDVQRSAIQAWARAEGHRVVRWTSDEGVSGSNGLDSRLGLLDAFGAIRDGSASGLVVYRLDRLARDLNLQETLLAELWRLKASVFSTSAAESSYLTEDPDDPSRRLIRQVLGAVAEYEKSMIALRLRSGRRYKAEKGGFAYGSPPFGYRSEGGELVEEPSEQETLLLIRDMHTGGESTRRIAAELERRQRKTKRGNTNWHSAAVARLIERTSAHSGPKLSGGS